MGTTVLSAGFASMMSEDWSSGSSHLLMIFVGIASFALLAQAVALVGMAIGAAKTQKLIQSQIEELKGKLMPLIDKSHLLVTDLTPQVKQIVGNVSTISTHVEDISALVREKVYEFGPTISAANETLLQANATVREANSKTQQQVARVDGMVSEVLNTTEAISRSIQHGISVPIREVSGILEGLKAGLVTFFSGGPRPKQPEYQPPSGTYEPRER
jgi:methyl-accepting chemotaxis protein